jgi:hypothetical protein
MRHADPEQRIRLRALGAELTEASRSRCEACGQAVPRVEPPRTVWRNHCGACRSMLATFIAVHDADAERHLWEAQADCTWPESEG